MSKPYPNWICAECGNKFGKGFPLNYIASWHMGKCDICQADSAVTEPRDFGHLRTGWDTLARKMQSAPKQ